MSKKNAVAVKDEQAAPMVQGTPYAQLVSDAAVIANALSNKCLDFYWGLGGKVNELLKAPDKYGNRKLENFAADVERTCQYSLGKSSFYNASAINAYMTKSQLEQAKSDKISMVRILALCTNKLTDGQRQAILLEAHNHQGPQVFDVKAAVDAKIAEATGGQPVVKEKPEPEEKIAKRIIKNSEKLVAVTASKLKLVGDAVATICKGGDKHAIDVAYEQWDDVSVEFDALTDMWQQQIAKVTKAFDKVKTVISKK